LLTQKRLLDKKETLGAWRVCVAGWPSSPKTPVVLPYLLPVVSANMIEHGQMSGNPEYKNEVTSQNKTRHHYKDAPVTALLIVVFEMTNHYFGPAIEPLNLEQQHSQVPT